MTYRAVVDDNADEEDERTFLAAHLRSPGVLLAICFAIPCFGSLLVLRGRAQRSRRNEAAMRTVQCGRDLWRKRCAATCSLQLIEWNRTRRTSVRP
mgnify:CR=1 FL=1